MASKPPSLIAAMDSPQFFRPWFKDPSTFSAWRAIVKLIDGIDLTEAERALLLEGTGRQTLPDQPATELWLGCGRRSGKSFIVALIAVWQAVSRDWTPYLSPGEYGTVMIM